jgi:hypothetical protein
MASARWGQQLRGNPSPKSHRIAIYRVTRFRFPLRYSISTAGICQIIHQEFCTSATERIEYQTPQQLMNCCKDSCSGNTLVENLEFLNKFVANPSRSMRKPMAVCLLSGREPAGRKLRPGSSLVSGTWRIVWSRACGNVGQMAITPVGSLRECLTKCVKRAAC